MGRLLLMVRKDLRRDVRAPLGLLLMLAFPLLFALLLGLTFGGGSASLPKVKVLLEDRDDGFASRALASAFTSDQVADHFEVEEVGEEGMARMEAGEASALFRIPENFTEDLLRGEATTLELVRNPTERIFPEIAEQLALSLTEILSAGSYVLRGPLGDVSQMIEDEGESVTDQSVASVSVSFRQLIDRSEDYLFPPAITLESVDLEDPEGESTGPGGLSIFLIVLPGVSVFALFMLGDQSMRDILVEAQSGTLRRQLAGPLGAGTVVAGKTLHTAVVATISLVILSVAG